MKPVKYAILLVAAALAVGGLTLVNVYASENAAPEGPQHGQLRERLKEKLSLTEDQIAKIKEQLKSEKDNITSLMTRLREAHTAVRNEIQNTSATEASVREAAAKLSAVESDLAVERMKLHGKISPILTPEQRAKLSQLQVGVDSFIERAANRVHDKLEE